MSGSSRRVLVVGDVMTDIIVTPEGPLVVGSDRRSTIRSRPGGSGANQAVWLGSLGADVRFVARVGAVDKPALERYFAGFGVSAVLSADAELPSGVLVTILNPDGERSFLTDRGANLNLSPDDVPPSVIDDTAMVLVSGYSLFAEKPRAAVTALLAHARSRGVATAVDAASEGFLREVGGSAFLAWTSGASILFANSEEAAFLSGAADLATQIAVLSNHFERVVVKLGSRGAVIGDGTGITVAAPAEQVSVLDTTGAGDAFAAAFLMAEINGDPPEKALRAAIRAGSHVVQQLGGQPQRAIQQI